MPALVNQTEIRVFGMSRSGNHAIIDWILAQATGRTCFLNCAEPAQNPFHWARPLGPTEPGCRASYPIDIEAERAGRLSPKDLLLHSYEDVFLGAFRDAANERRSQEHVGRSGRQIDVLILRDPFNLFASRVAGRAGILRHDVAMRVWCQHARQYVGKRRYLRADTVCISYNAWTASRRYRRQLAQELGLAFDDSAAPRVPACAGGSSFDGTSHDGSATTMEVFDRWRRYVGDPHYLSLFTPEVLGLADAAFGDLEPAATLAELSLAA